MKNREEIIEKRIYNSPEIIYIELDNEISLALESNPPDGPGESIGYNQNNPFKEDIGLV